MSVPLLSAPRGVQLFGRSYSLTVQGASRSAVFGNEGTRPTALRIAFNVTRQLAAPNTAKISIFNLSPHSRLLMVKAVPLRLRAGYLGLAGTVFQGIIAKAATERQGADIVTSIEAVDSEPFAHMSVWDRTYAAGTTLTEVLADLAAAMFVDYASGTVVRIDQGVAIGIPAKVYTNGLQVHGPCSRTLTKLCRPLGLNWSVQNGALTVIPKKHYDGRTAVVLSDQTGLIGVPSDTGDCKTFSSLLNPRIVPGCLVQLQTRTEGLSGSYKVRKATYAGDSHDAAWNVDCEGVAYDGQIVPLTSLVGRFATAVSSEQAP